MKKLLLAAAATLPLLLASPANALLTVNFSASGTGGSATGGCSDGSGCDASGLTDVLQTNFQTLGQFSVFGTLSISSTGTLTASNFGIQNNGGAGTLQMLVGDTGFTTPVQQIALSASGTFINMVGSPASTAQFYAAAGSSQPTFGSPGGLLFTASSVPSAQVDSFQGTNNVPFILLNGTFTMAELATFNFLSGGSVVGYNAGMAAISQQGSVPEPSIWALMLIGFAGLAWAGMRKRRYSREWHGGEYVAQSPVGQM